MGRANLRLIGLTDDRIDVMTTRQAQAAMIAYEVIQEQMMDRRREQEWISRASAGGPTIAVKTMADARSVMTDGGDSDA